MLQEKPLKVLMLASGYPRNREDNSSIFLKHLAHHLSRREIKLHVLAPANQRGGTYCDDEVEVHRFQYLPARLQKLAYGSGILPNLKQRPLLWLQVPFFIASMAASLVITTRKERPDLIHAHWVLPQGAVAVFVKPLSKAPIITSLHGSDAFRLNGKFFRWLKRLVLRRSEAWTANSRATSKAFEKDACVSVSRIIPMGVDVRRFQNGQRALLRHGLSESDFVILFVGRLIPEKGLEELFTAVMSLPEELQRRIRLWIVGEGHYREELEARARRDLAQESVRFWGQIGNDRLPDFYASSDLFVAPSRMDEGQGVVLLEAAAAKTSIIATRVGGIPEIVEDGHTGLLVEPNDSHQLAKAIERLLLDPVLRMGLAQNAYGKVENVYDWEKVAEEFEKLYRSVISRKKKSPLPASIVTSRRP